MPACSGLLPSMMGVAHVAIQFPLYEAFKAKLAERHHRDPTELPAADLVRLCLREQCLSLC